MLSRAQLERVAQTVTHGNTGHAETLYLQDMILSTVSRETADQLVFKGGTALLKFYQLDRFSDVLDFTARGTLDYEGLVGKAERDLENYGAAVAERSVEASGASVTARLAIRGPLYTGDRRSLNFIRLEVNRESSVEQATVRRYTPPFTDIPSFDLLVLDEREILAEKVRALMTRREPRDLYDVYHLLEKSVSLDPALVRAKLEYYGIEYDAETLLDRARSLEGQWPSLATLTYSDPPAFARAMDALEREVTRVGSTG